MNGTNGPLITMDQWMGIVRQLVPFASGIAVGKGWLTMDQAGELGGLILQIAGPIGLVVGAIMTYIANSKKSILTSAGKMPEVNTVNMNDKQLAESVPSDKVVNGK
jgi:hypothetical protein